MSSNEHLTDSVHLSGEGNTFKITGTQKSLLQVTRSNLCIDNSSELLLKGDQNHLHLRNCANVRISGSQNDVHADRIIDGIVHGVDNGISVKSIVHFVLSGSRDVCELRSEVSPKIYGNENRVIASENVHLLVCGSSNCVVAQNNSNLKIRGNYSNVVAFNSCNATVDGQRSQVRLEDTAVAHHLMRTPIGSTNHVRFTGSPLKCCVYDGICFPSFESPQLFPNRGGMGKGVGSSQIQLFGPLASPRLPTNKGGNVSVLEPSYRRATNVFVPKLDISYVDRISIFRNQYILGIFHFQVDVWDGDESPSILCLQISSRELDEGSLSSTIVEGEKGSYAIVVGRKDGIRQTLRLSGPRIRKRDEDEFLVDLDPALGNPGSNLIL